MRASTVAVAVAALAIFACASAHGEGHSGSEDSSSSRMPGYDKPRDIQYSLSGSNRELQVDARSPGNDRARLRFEFKFDGFPRIRARVQSRANENESSFTFRMGFRRLIEFLPTAGRADPCFVDGDARFTVLNLVGLNGDRGNFRDRWSQIAATTRNESGVVWRDFSSTYSFQGTNLTLRVQIAPQLLRTNQNVTLSPNGLKIWVGINNFKFNRTDTKLAIETFVQSRTQSQQLDSTSIGVGSGNGQLTWVPNMLSGSGQTLPVNAAQPANDDVSELEGAEVETESGETVKRIVYCVQGNQSSYLWDPTIQVSDTSSALVVRPSLLLALLAVALTLLCAAL